MRCRACCHHCWSAQTPSRMLVCILKNLPTLETERLILGKMTLDDAGAVFAYASDSEVTRYVIWNMHRTIEDSKSFLRSLAEEYENAEAADWGSSAKRTAGS
jgi:ribosomal-protein-alanine N-acetyltransferase